MKNILLVIMLLFVLSVQGQKREVEYCVSLSGFIAAQKTLPFWVVSNRHGLVADGRGGLFELGIFSDFTTKRVFQFAYGVSAAGVFSRTNNKVMVDQLYVSGKWHKLRLDLGMIHPEEEYNGISSTNGDFVRSGNSRTLPGYNLRSDYINIPFAKGYFSFKFNWGDYLMIDNDYAKDVRLHNKSIYVKITPHPKLEVIVGLEHWAQWAGTTPVGGQQPASFKDYIRIVCAEAGGEGATRSDSLNVLGNHLGREHLRINYKADKFMLSFYHDIPFEDGSGTDFRSFPDGTYCFYYGAKDKKRWVSDVIYEFYYTKYQSGSLHDRPATPKEMAKQDPNSPFYGRKILGGRDSYFNHGEYRNGWTLYGKTIGSPLMTTGFVDGVSMVVNSRIIAHHLGIKGVVFKTTPYKLLLTYSKNYGIYDIPLINKPQQFSGAFEVILPFKKIPFTMETGVYGDFGSLFKNNVGFMITLSRKGYLKK